MQFSSLFTTGRRPITAENEQVMYKNETIA
jgi:hypothetical protein